MTCEKVSLIGVTDFSNNLINISTCLLGGLENLLTQDDIIWDGQEICLSFVKEKGRKYKKLINFRI